MKKNKGFAPIAIVLIIIAVLAVGGVAYFIGTKNSLPTPPSENTGGDPAISQNLNTGICGTNGEFCPGNLAYESRIRQETNHTCNVSKDPVVVIISPNEGQIYNTSEPVTIKWASCSSIENVFIGLAEGGHDKGLISEKPIKSSLGSFEWTTPNIPSLNYKISITSSVAPYTQKIVNFKVK